MTDQEIKSLIEQFEFPPEMLRELTLLCEEVERRTRTRFYNFILNANNAALDRRLSSSTLEQIIYNLNKTT